MNSCREASADISVHRRDPLCMKRKTPMKKAAAADIAQITGFQRLRGIGLTPFSALKRPIAFCVSNAPSL
jgi:hypothetical protein